MVNLNFQVDQDQYQIHCQVQRQHHLVSHIVTLGLSPAFYMELSLLSPLQVVTLAVTADATDSALLQASYTGFESSFG